jgi:hypothetical protein
MAVNCHKADCTSSERHKTRKQKSIKAFGYIPEIKAIRGFTDFLREVPIGRFNEYGELTISGSRVC